MRRLGVRIHEAWVLFALLSAVPASFAQQASEDRPPIDVGLFEETEVRRLFIDVEALDRDGRPMPGLTRDDFRIRLNYLWRKIVTVDDLCPCVEDRFPVVVDGIDPDPDPDPDVTARLAEIETRYVVYFDFSQLPPRGRQLAVGHAERWVREVLKPGDEVMVVAYATDSGLLELAPFSSNHDRILDVLGVAASDPRFADPFPGAFGRRLEMCGSGTLSCYHTARKDYFQAQRSLRSVLGFVTRMDAIPGRKVLLLFHQNMTMFPGRRYAAPGQRLGSVMLDGMDSGTVPDLIDMVGEVGAAATTSRTEVYPIVMGAGGTWTVNFGANLADFTGGDYNRGAHDLLDLLDETRTSCKCIYRIGLEPPSSKSRVYRVKVKVRGRNLSSRYRVHYLTRFDRWAREASAVLINPEDGWDLDIGAALVPGTFDDGRWSMQVQVALELDALALSPEGQDRHREWEVGALLAHQKPHKTERVWEMLGFARLEQDALLDETPLTLHERTFERLRPGTYELRAFVHDRTGDTYGGARVEIHLPDSKPKRAGMAGPLILRPAGRHRVAALPLRKAWHLMDWMRVVPRESGFVSSGLPPLRRGDPVRFDSWVCAGRPPTEGSVFRRYVAGGDEPLLRFPPDRGRAMGGCRHLTDRLDTSVLAEGRYEYRIDGPATPGPEPEGVAFEIGAKVGRPTQTRP